MKWPIVLVAALSMGAASVQDDQKSSGVAGALATVRITHPVRANGEPLAPGVYDLRLTGERPTPLPGQSPDAERWIEFVSNGNVVAREVAVVLRDADLPAIGASSVPSRGGTRVDLLRGGEFLRISVRRGAERYLVYLPVVQ